MRKTYSKEKRSEIIQTWAAGLGSVRDIAEAHNMPASTVYGMLERAGLWKGEETSKPSHPTRQSIEYLLMTSSDAVHTQIAFNREHRNVRGGVQKINAALHLFIAKAVGQGHSFSQVSEVVHLDPQTVSKYARQILDIPHRRRLDPKEMRHEQDPGQLVIDGFKIKPMNEPKPGLLKRLWRWLFG
jgi:transposase-like protein